MRLDERRGTTSARVASNASLYLQDEEVEIERERERKKESKDRGRGGTKSTKQNNERKV